MTQAEKLSLLRREFTSSSDDKLLAVLLNAESIIHNRVYGFVSGEHALTESQQLAAVEVAKRLMYKEGAEGQIGHSENGISRTWEDSSGFEDVFKAWGIVPYVGVPI